MLYFAKLTGEDLSRYLNMLIWVRRFTKRLLLLLCVFSFLQLFAITQSQTPLERHSSHRCHQSMARWLEVGLGGQPTIWQPGFDLPRRYWSKINHVWTNQGHWAFCQCGKCQTVFYIVNICSQTKLEGGL